MKRCAWFLAFVLPCVSGGLVRAAPRYFPLEVGNRWTYVVEHEFFTGMRDVTVHAEEDGLFVVRTRADGADMVVRLRANGNEIDIELEGEGLVPNYRFEEDSWLHRDRSKCDDNATVTVVARDEVVATPAGVFTDCLKLVFLGSCDDAGTLAQWWAPEVGLVKSEEDNFAGAATWLLTDFTRAGQELGFLRGDVNEDGHVDIADMISLLAYLFLGGPGPVCLDVADVNDDGAIDIADPTAGLNYLFLGGSEPPAPGPKAPGFDGTPTDQFFCGDPLLTGLPGVSFDLSGNPRTITLAEAAAGVSFRYAIVIEHDIDGVFSRPLDGGRCDQPDASGLRILERIHGDRQVYCLCDTGRCLPMTDVTDLRAGRYEATFEWTGRNWWGPSDTNNPMGDAFPPGTYTFEIRAEGLYPAGEDCPTCQVPFQMAATVEFELVP